MPECFYTRRLCGIGGRTVSRNWRLTFRVNAAPAIEDMDLEDYP